MSEKEFMPIITLPLPHLWVCCICGKAHADKDSYGTLDIEHLIQIRRTPSPSVCYCCSHCSNKDFPSNLHRVMNGFKHERTAKQTNYLTDMEFKAVFVYGI